MNKFEAKLAVELNAICEHGGIEYYAYGIQYTKMPDQAPRESIMLHSLVANSCTIADRKRTTVKDWKAPAEYIEKRLASIKERYIESCEFLPKDF